MSTEPPTADVTGAIARILDFLGDWTGHHPYDPTDPQYDRLSTSLIDHPKFGDIEGSLRSSDIRLLLAHHQQAVALLREVADSPDLDPGQCPYYARYARLPGHDPEAICDRGCHDEPSCITDIPTEGWLSRRVADYLAALPTVEPCTGLTATWCPNHGDCTCQRHDDGEIDLGGDSACPLHGQDSTHIEPLRQIVDRYPTTQEPTNG